MWGYTICEKGGVTIYRDRVKLYSLAPYNSIEVNIINSIKYIADLISLHIDIKEKSEMVEFIDIACMAMNELNNMWINNLKIKL